MRGSQNTKDLKDLSLEMQKPGKIYLDFNATSPLHPRIHQEIGEVLNIWGNPSSIHWAGQKSKKILREARQNISAGLGVSPLEIIFTSGGSESNSTVLQSFFQSCTLGRNEFITTNIEHPSILKTLRDLQSRGAIVHFLQIPKSGQFPMEQYKNLLSSKTALVTIMLANNETGVIFPVRELADLAHAAGAKFHTDAVQALGKIPVNLQDLGVDFASFSAHKFYAFKGTGILFCKKTNELKSLIFGGQERGRRGGTENLLGIWSLGLVSQELPSVAEKAKKIQNLRDQMEQLLLAKIPCVRLTHGLAPRLSNTSSLVIDQVDGDTLLMSLDVKGIAVSTGAACSSGSPEPSPTLLALGLSREEAQSSLRISLGWSTTEAEINTFVEILTDTVTRIRSLQKPPEVSL